MRSGADLADLGRVHIVGIGGAGMSGIASILAARGVHVTGSDAKESRRVQSLRALGIEVSVGHQKSIAADTLVYSTAIPESNSERRFAREHSIPEMSRLPVEGPTARMQSDAPKMAKVSSAV